MYNVYAWVQTRCCIFVCHVMGNLYIDTNMPFSFRNKSCKDIKINSQQYRVFTHAAFAEIFKMVYCAHGCIIRLYAQIHSYWISACMSFTNGIPKLCLLLYYMSLHSPNWILGNPFLDLAHPQLPLRMDRDQFVKLLSWRVDGLKYIIDSNPLPWLWLC